MKDVPGGGGDPLLNIRDIPMQNGFSFFPATFNQMRDVINNLKNKKSKVIYGLDVRLIKSVMDSGGLSLGS